MFPAAATTTTPRPTARANAASSSDRAVRGEREADRLAFFAAVCTGATPRSDQSSAITIDGRAIDGDPFVRRGRVREASIVPRDVWLLALWQGGPGLCVQAAQGEPATILLTGKQSYGRPIGTIEVGEQVLREAMITAGLAVPATSYLKSEPARAQRYVAAHEMAQHSQPGAHAGYFIDPAK